MSKGPATALTDHRDTGSAQIASSAAVVVGTARLGEGEDPLDDAEHGREALGVTGIEQLYKVSDEMPDPEKFAIIGIRFARLGRAGKGRTGGGEEWEDVEVADDRAVVGWSHCRFGPGAVTTRVSSLREETPRVR
jgi:hypothetical protein